MNYNEKDEKTFYKDYFKSAVTLFIKKSQNKNESRYKSWEYCYNFFHSVHEKISDKKLSLKSPFGDDGQKWTYKDQLSLHLAFYMASWGMYRGSSFLLQNDYTIYYGVINVIFKDDYKELWNNENLLKENMEERIGLTLDIYKDIQNALYRFKDFYDTKSYFCIVNKNSSEEDREGLNPKFLTIITKIMLGTIGCFPALDRNFKYGFGISDGSKKSDFVEQTIKRVFDLVLDKKEEIESAVEEIKKEIECDELPPIMKAIDMYYFIKGQEDNFLYNLGFKKSEFNGVAKKEIRENIKGKIDGIKEEIENALPEKRMPEKSKNALKFLYNNIYKKDPKKDTSPCFDYIANPIIRQYCEENLQSIKDFIGNYYRSDKEEDDEE